MCGPLREQRPFRKVSAEYIHKFVQAAKIKKDTGHPMSWSLDVEPDVSLECEVLKAIHIVCTIQDVRMARFGAKLQTMITLLFINCSLTRKIHRIYCFKRRWRKKLEEAEKENKTKKVPKETADSARARIICDFLWGAN